MSEPLALEYMPILPFTPRWYQLECVNRVLWHYYEGNKGHPLISQPTGTGKGHGLAMLAATIRYRWPQQRILVLTHTEDIVKQDANYLTTHVPFNEVGVFCAGLNRKEVRPYTVASIQSIANKRHLCDKFTFIIVDEAHRIPVKSEGQYRKFLDSFDDVPIVGLTATPYRLGGGYLYGEGKLFSDLIYEVPMLKLINQGFLSNLISTDPTTVMDVEGVHTLGGDFNKKELLDKCDRQTLTDAICSDLVPYLATYKKALVFTIDIEHAAHVTITLAQLGIHTGIVHSKRAKTQNDSAKQQFRTGELQALVNVDVLTTGYDDPSIDLIALLRPTKSPVLHVQMIGRGMRVVYHKSMPITTDEQRLAAIAAGPKPHCRVLDYAGNIQRLGPINDIQISRKKKKSKGHQIVKTCPKCRSMTYPSVRVCMVCGHEFEFIQKLTPDASKKKVLRTETKPQPLPPQWYDVASVDYQQHVSRQGRVTLQVAYRCGLRTFFEYKSFDPRTPGGYHTLHWWSFRCNNSSRPESAMEAVARAKQGELKTPRKILVDEAGKYPSVKDYLF